jgi:F-type H+-transporting ATPase subunit b
MNETTTPAPGNGDDVQSLVSTTATAVVGASAPAGKEAEMGSVLAVSDRMVAMTWLAFLLACFALYKLAWKPICQALERREDKIRQSLKEAADIQANAAMDREAQKAMMADATREAAAIVERARTAAEATARAIEVKSRAEAEAAVRDAAGEIGKAKEKALVELRREAGSLALEMAGRVIGQKLDAAADRDLTDRLIKEIQ